MHLTPDIRLRPITLADADALAEAYRRSRAHLAPWEPRRPEEWFTAAGQKARLAGIVEECAAGRLASWVLVHGGGDIAGSVTLSAISSGVFRSASLGYWIDVDHIGRGLASAAVTAVCEAADRELDLHRVEAGTLPHNTASQRVLAKCGFEEYGLAPKYLHIDGAWRDHRLFQRVLNDRQP